QEKVTKEKGTLAPAVARASCARDCASALRGLPTAHPCADGKLGAIPRAAPSGCSSAHSPPPKGNPDQPKRGLPGRRSRLLVLIASARRSALLLRVPVSAGGRRPEQPAGARAR